MKKLVYLMLVVVLALVLAGCGRPTPETIVKTVVVEKEGQKIVETVVVEKEVVVTATPAPKEKVTLTYLVSQGWLFDAEMELGKKFEEQTGIAIDYQVVPADQYFTVLKTKLNSGEGPDIFGGQSGKTDLKVQYDVEKNAVDLSDQPWVKSEDPLVLEQSTLDGKVYGLTIWDVIGTTWVVNYNKDIFARLNLSVPTTYADLMAACEAIKVAGITPIYEPVSDGWHHVLWFPELGPRYEEVTPGLADRLNANEAKFADDPTMLTALTQLNELYDAGCFGSNALSDAYADASKQIAEGSAAMAVGNLVFAQSVKNDYPEFDAESLGVFVIPLADNQVLNINPAGPTKFIYKGSKHVAEAQQYFNFLTQPENLQYLIDNTPAVNSLPFTGIKGTLLPSQQAFLDAHTKRGTVYQTAVTYVNPQWMDIGKDLTAMFTKAMSPAEVLASIDKRRAELATAAKDPAWSK
ncbi:MAG TPA: ABC transporter substrate-binding protein [Anaerolineae bacterium]|nr:ABC transporter substrate-binding protein [Anaerolineae bacterium]HQI86335.1 ABC transporter substrate-binding protein [Anaerolineae bacterium]